jgi:hypothetical protein
MHCDAAEPVILPQNLDFELDLFEREIRRWKGKG